MDARVAMSLIDGGIRAYAVEIPVSVNVPKPDAFSPIDDDIQRKIVASATFVVQGDILASPIRNCFHHFTKRRTGVESPTPMRKKERGDPAAYVLGKLASIDFTDDPFGHLFRPFGHFF